MSIADFIQSKGIKEILHFTTNSGLTGILASSGIRCRNLLKEDAYLEHIYKQTCPDRSRDRSWHGFVNLSVSRINSQLFGIAEGNWHSGIDGWWCICSINPCILEHEGVWFTTTNNIYPSVRRSKGEGGLQEMFDSPIYGRYNSEVLRTPNLADCSPTCPQAEVLYPQQVPLDFIRGIYVREPDHADAVHGMFSALDVAPIPVEINSAIFEGHVNRNE